MTDDNIIDINGQLLDRVLEGPLPLGMTVQEIIVEAFERSRRIGASDSLIAAIMAQIAEVVLEDHGVQLEWRGRREDVDRLFAASDAARGWQ
jgi:hypothetical protein